jgi:CheY-like chemotaxis protein
VKLLLLVVDDELVIHRTISRALDPGAVSCTFVTSMAQALAALRARTFDVILLDLNLQDSVGMASFSAARAVSPTTPIVVLTGGGTAPEELLEAGASQVLIKDGTLTAEIIRGAVSSACDRTPISKPAEAQTNDDALESFRRDMKIVDDLKTFMRDEISALEDRQVKARAVMHDELSREIASVKEKKKARFDMREFAAAVLIILSGLKTWTDSLKPGAATTSPAQTTSQAAPVAIPSAAP